MYFNSTNSTAFGFFYHNEFTPFEQCLIPLSIILTCLIYPFYVFVFRTNLDVENRLPVFYAINYFYRNLKIVLISVYYSLFFFALDAIMKIDLFARISYLSILISYFILYCSFQVNNLVLSILAIQRFTIYFFPETQKYFPGDLVKWMIRGALFICILVSLHQVSIVFTDKKSQFVYGFYGILLALSLISGCFYIPIVISVNKLTSLTSIQSSKPQRYVFWQFIALFIQKAILEFFFNIDLFVMPVLIQLSYLGCNRRNLMTLFSSVNPKKFFKIFCCFCFIFQEGNVEPTIQN
uniref:Serpentine receptor class gamma n=1 Tax=Caenorhabditis tropicalis TaxID=1561998 RepID=A0A1I7TH64_9PELO